MKGTQRKTWQTLFMVLPAIMLCVLFCKTDVMAATKNHTMKAGTTYNIKNADYSTTVYHKITVNSPGFITLTGWEKYPTSSSKNGMYIRLYNSKKMALEGKNVSALVKNGNYTGYYAVKKGTYYVQTKACKNYRLKYTFTKVTDKSGNSKAKALGIKRNTKYKGLLLAGESGKTADWYKFTLSKEQYISLAVGVKANNSIRFQIYPGNSANAFTNGYAYGARGNTKMAGRLKAGTYYVKVSRQGNKKGTNGYYYLNLVY